MTRIQKERFADLEEYELLKDCYRLDAEKMNKASENMLVMHPLPRVNEIATEVDNDKRAVYFQQARVWNVCKNGFNNETFRGRCRGVK